MVSTIFHQYLTYKEQNFMERRKAGRPQKTQTIFTITLRLEEADVDALDKIGDQLSQSEGIRLSRMDLLRKAVKQFIEREKKTD